MILKKIVSSESGVFQSTHCCHDLNGGGGGGMDIWMDSTIAEDRQSLHSKLTCFEWMQLRFIRFRKHFKLGVLPVASLSFGSAAHPMLSACLHGCLEGVHSFQGRRLLRQPAGKRMGRGSTPSHEQMFQMHMCSFNSWRVGMWLHLAPGLIQSGLQGKSHASMLTSS